MRIYIVGPPEDVAGDEYVEAKYYLECKGHTVVCNPKNDDLRWALTQLITSRGICLLDVWWSDLQATQLQTVASWLGHTHFDPKGEVLPTGGLR